MLTEAALWLDDRLLLPAFLYSIGGSRTAAVAFDVDPADVEEYTEGLHDPASWPFLTVQLARGHCLYILFRNFGDDSGWDYLLQSAGSDSVMTLAALEGCFRRPALSWPELLTAADQPDPTRSRAKRILLLLPALGDAGRPHDAEELVARPLLLSVLGSSTGVRLLANYWQRAVASGVPPPGSNVRMAMSASADTALAARKHRRIVLPS